METFFSASFWDGSRGVWCHAGRTGQNKVGPVLFCENTFVWVFALLDKFVMSMRMWTDSSVLGANCIGAQHIYISKTEIWAPAVIMLCYCLASWVMRVCSGMWPGNTDISTQIGEGGGMFWVSTLWIWLWRHPELPDGLVIGHTGYFGGVALPWLPCRILIKSTTSLSVVVYSSRELACFHS